MHSPSFSGSPSESDHPAPTRDAESEPQTRHEAVDEDAHADATRRFCLRILESGDLASKMAPPEVAGQPDAPPAGPLSGRTLAPVFIDRPARDASIALRSGSDRLPRAHALVDPQARVVCLERFANHELQAVELFAWFLVAFPDIPAGLRRGLVRTLVDEQRHLGFYLDRIADLGGCFGDRPLTDYFWQQAPSIRNAGSGGVRAFLCAMGLTFEQANLDYSAFYAGAFEAAGDAETARAIRQVHRDEIRHVRLAMTWLRRLRHPGESDIDAYLGSVPFPLSAARAKGRRFEVEARRQAGLSEEMIAFVRDARPYEDRRDERREASRADVPTASPPDADPS